MPGSTSSSSLNTLFSFAAKMQASDLHIAADETPVLRIAGRLSSIQDAEVIPEKTLLAEIKKLLTEQAFVRFSSHQDTDLSIELPDHDRFRLNVYWKRGKPALAARYIPAHIPELDDLEAPEAALDFVGLNQGLVLVTGPTGAGKSTLLASMIEYINRHRVQHIVTLEDPIEFVYEPKQCLVSQREAGNDFLSFSDGLKHLFRQDPDIILVGEMRDPETVATALTLAETGHLVFSTLHTNSASQTLERIIDMFPGVQQQQIRQQLSLVLKGVISQLLLPATDGTLTPVHEVLVNTNAVANLIREGRTEQIQNVILTSQESRMVDLDQELMLLLEDKRIEKETARQVAHNPKTFK